MAVMNVKRALLLSMGFLSLGVGIVGIALPVLPTTPFLLLSAFCFSGSSKRLHNLLLKSKWLASYIENYTSKTGVPKTVKMQSLIFLWATLTASMLIFQKDYLFVLLPLVGAGVTMHILLIKTKKETES
jgi:uncharacterized membrane protein YbaN (DUF454 family)